MTHHSGFLVLKITEEADKVSVITKEIATGQIRRFESDRVYVCMRCNGHHATGCEFLELI